MVGEFHVPPSQEIQASLTVCARCLLRRPYHSSELKFFLNLFETLSFKNSSFLSNRIEAILNSIAFIVFNSTCYKMTINQLYIAGKPVDVYRYFIDATIKFIVRTIKFIDAFYKCIVASSDL